jgi:hypothetical protein
VSGAHPLAVEHASVVDPAQDEVAVPSARQELNLVRDIGRPARRDQRRVHSRIPIVNSSE